MGAKFRVLNLMRRGVPVYVTLAAGLGLDDTWDKETEGPDGTVETGIADWRAWGGLGLSVGLGPIEACVDAGQIHLGRWIDDNAPDEIEDVFTTEGVSSFFVRPGVELALAPAFSVYAGARMIRELEDTEYYLQIRLRSGK